MKLSAKRWEKFVVQDLVLLVIGAVVLVFAFAFTFTDLNLLLLFAGLGLMGVAGVDVCRLVWFCEVIDAC